MQRRTKMSAEGCDEMAEGYFTRCREQDRHPSLPGLALALGLDSRQELDRIASGSGRVARAIRRAMTRVEEESVQLAYCKDTAACAKFLLQNGFGYREKPGPAARDDIRVEIGP